MTSASPPIRSVVSVEDDVAAAAAIVPSFFAGAGFCFFGAVLFGRAVCFFVAAGF
jgi:hypothetical protein